mmetsp:Transcript_46407/g.137102  ORF Transcript_46407/g.137102 Transcript_46407/m.137102 type:complete len:249 (-) Transcript_46407:316-1062(-)
MVASSPCSPVGLACCPGNRGTGSASLNASSSENRSPPRPATAPPPPGAPPTPTLADFICCCSAAPCANDCFTTSAPLPLPPARPLCLKASSSLEPAATFLVMTTSSPQKSIFSLISTIDLVPPAPALPPPAVRCSRALMSRPPTLGATGAAAAAAFFGAAPAFIEAQMSSTLLLEPPPPLLADFFAAGAFIDAQMSSTFDLPGAGVGADAGAAAAGAEEAAPAATCSLSAALAAGGLAKLGSSSLLSR